MLAALPPAAFADPILDFVDQPVPVKANGQKFTLEEVQAAIIKASTARKWVPVLTEPGKFSVSVLVRGKHYAEVTIPFNETNYSILYAASRELDANEKKRKIHGKYNQWVGSLNAEIGRTLALATTGT
jgi:hypothetical protein